jgi:hypothetical protein
MNVRGIVRTSLVSVNGRSYQNLEAFAQAGAWETLYCESSNAGKGGRMVQTEQFL